MLLVGPNCSSCSSDFQFYTKWRISLVTLIKARFTWLSHVASYTFYSGTQRFFNFQSMTERSAIDRQDMQVDWCFFPLPNNDHNIFWSLERKVYIFGNIFFPNKHKKFSFSFSAAFVDYSPTSASGLNSGCWKELDDKFGTATKYNFREKPWQFLFDLHFNEPFRSSTMCNLQLLISIFTSFTTMLSSDLTKSATSKKIKEQTLRNLSIACCIGALLQSASDFVAIWSGAMLLRVNFNTSKEISIVGNRTPHYCLHASQFTISDRHGPAKATKFVKVVNSLNSRN